ADGLRVLLFTNIIENQPETFLIDRRNDYYSVNFFLPSPEDIENKFLDNTLLDAEIVIDVEEDNKHTLRLLLFDCIIYESNNLSGKPYTSRLGRLTNFVIGPFKKKLEKDKDYARKLPFQMDLKKLHLSYGLAMVFEEIPKLKHKSDGIIFTSSVGPYVGGTCDKILKWKPSDENTVDFKVEIKGDPNNNPTYNILIWIGGRQHQFFQRLTVDKETQTLFLRKNPHNRVIECRYDPCWEGSWRFVRFRDDKDKANHISVYEKIMTSINDNIEKSDLLNHADIIKAKWKVRNKK
ncbi:Dcp1p-Dcp2p decapping enzyme complex alpha subunit, partial [Clydaea vesicula]